MTRKHRVRTQPLDRLISPLVWLVRTREATVTIPLAIWVISIGWAVWRLTVNPAPAEQLVIRDLGGAPLRVSTTVGYAIFDGESIWSSANLPESSGYGLVRMNLRSGSGQMIRVSESSELLIGIARGSGTRVALAFDDPAVVVLDGNTPITYRKFGPYVFDLIAIGWNADELEVLERGCAVCKGHKDVPVARKGDWRIPPTIHVFTIRRKGASWTTRRVQTPQPKVGWDMQNGAAELTADGWRLTYTSANLAEAPMADYQTIEISTASERGEVFAVQRLELPSSRRQWPAPTHTPEALPGRLAYHYLDRRIGGLVVTAHFHRPLVLSEGTWKRDEAERARLFENYYLAEGGLKAISPMPRPPSRHPAFSKDADWFPAPGGGWWYVALHGKNPRYVRFDARGRRVGGPSKLDRMVKMLSGRHVRPRQYDTLRPSTWQHVSVVVVLLGLPLVLGVAVFRRTWFQPLVWGYAVTALILMQSFIRAVRLI